MVGTDRRGNEVFREVLPDGTLHKKVVLTRRDSDAQEQETLETFEHPPKLDQDMEVIEEVLPDGTKVMRRVSISRVVHTVKTRHESFDENSGRRVEDYEVEEVVPNTCSAFDAGVDSDYEEEQLQKRARALSLEQDMEVIEETMPDGTKVMRKVTASRVVHATQGKQDAFDSRKGQVHEEYPSYEVVPNTFTAFHTGVDSDYEEEQLQKRTRALSLEQDMGVIEETMPDGTKVKRMVTASRVVHANQGKRDSLDGREGQVHEEYTCEVVPGTVSAFVSGQDSD